VAWNVFYHPITSGKRTMDVEKSFNFDPKFGAIERGFNSGGIRVSDPDPDLDPHWSKKLEIRIRIETSAVPRHWLVQRIQQNSWHIEQNVQIERF
jgi:hypothetical protein